MAVYLRALLLQLLHLESAGSTSRSEWCKQITWDWKKRPTTVFQSNFSKSKYEYFRKRDRHACDREMEETSS